jgi:3-hydroxy-9,10-secoandrosta-1,3,5(10)-triene-9,17-dione monooxygenase reductase component
MREPVSDGLEPGGATPARFREVLASFATGVTIITALDGEEMAGMSANSFTAVSLEPPLVAFCAAVTSTTYPRIRRAGRFCVNVLAEDQVEVAKLFSLRGVNRFAEVSWAPAPSGAAILDGVLAWVDCDIVAEYPAGDHHLVIGAVHHLQAAADRAPLLFFRSSYGIERATIPLGDAPPPTS